MNRPLAHDPLFGAALPGAPKRAQGSPAGDFRLPCTPTAAGDMTTAFPPPPGGDAVPGPALSSPPVGDEAEGGTPEGVRPAPARRTAGGAPVSRITPAGAPSPDGKAALPSESPRLRGRAAPGAGLSGKAAMDAVRAEKARQAKERRGRRGKPRQKPGYQAGGNIRYPDGAA